MSTPRSLPPAGSDPATLDLADPLFWTDPQSILRAARERGPTARTSNGDLVLLRADDVEFAHSDPRFRNPGVENLERSGISDGPFYEWRKSSLAALEGDEHQQLRTWVSRLFTPRQVSRLREGFRGRADFLLEKAAREKEEIEIVYEYARALPLWAVCHFLGIPDEDREELASFLFGTEEAFTAALTPEIRARAEAAIVALYEYSQRLIERRLAHPGDDALSELVASRSEADGVSDENFLALIVNIFGGAVGSTSATIANSIHLLLSHPEQAELVRREPERIKPAIEECLRFAPPFRIGQRVVAESLEAFGHALRPGDGIFIWRAAANRDPTRFENPDTFDIERPPNPHISFGHGPHFCLGHALGRIQAQQAILALLTGHPEAALVTRDPERVPFTMDEKLTSLIVRL
ncbi:MAG: cytochrome P450 [bacterium]|nr:cytochrome P450 [bacterium]